MMKVVNSSTIVVPVTNLAVIGGNMYTYEAMGLEENARVEFRVSATNAMGMSANATKFIDTLIAGDKDINLYIKVAFLVHRTGQMHAQSTALHPVSV